MRHRLTGSLISAGLLTAWALGWGGCSTQELAPAQPPSAAVPAYVQVSHPNGYELGDVRAMFHEKAAPGPETVKTCDADYRKLQSMTQSKDELREGAEALVKQDPVGYHWCFYGKLLALEDLIKSESYIDVRQKAVLETYGFLVPIARAFMHEFRDSRYLRFAIRHYRRVSEWVFFRKLDLSPQATGELVEVESPFGQWRQPVSSENHILEKYHLAQPTASPSSEPSPAPSVAASGTPAAAPVAAAMPTPAPSEVARDPASEAMDAAFPAFPSFPSLSPTPTPGAEGPANEVASDAVTDASEAVEASKPEAVPTARPEASAVGPAAKVEGRAPAGKAEAPVPVAAPAAAPAVAPAVAPAAAGSAAAATAPVSSVAPVGVPDPAPGSAKTEAPLPAQSAGTSP